MKFSFKTLGSPQNIPTKLWTDWRWQLKNMQKNLENTAFLEGTTPYYQYLASHYPILKNISKSTEKEYRAGAQQMKDPLGEAQHSPHPYLIHRYPDRVLFLITDNCGLYCRYCTRKRFTGQNKAFISKENQEKCLSYIKKNPGIREVILSGGDPLTLSDSLLEKILSQVRSIEHIEIIRLASRMPVVCPMRLTKELLKIFKDHQPLFLMTHFNHPSEISKEAQIALNQTADAGILMFNQTVLLNKINNHPALIQALMRRLLYLRVKPYYMFQCDPSEGTEHFRTSVENSKWIQRELWGRLSGLALPNLSLDIPGGGGKVGLVPDFLIKKSKNSWKFKGWDDLEEAYVNPLTNQNWPEEELGDYKQEWEYLKNQSYGKKP